MTDFHRTWRVEAIKSLEYFKEQDFHFSNVVSVSKETAYKIGDILINTQKKVNDLAKADVSNKDVLCSICIDLFKL
jgi:hypothetical protein